MAIDRTKLKQIHNLLAQNGFAQDYDTFEKKFAGNANYGNRKKVYDLITENGGDIGGSYEDFMKRLQSKPKPKQQPSKSQTTSQRAMQMGGRQLPKPKNVPSNASPFVKSLYAKDLMERGEQQPTDYVSKREDYTSPKAVQNMSRRSQKAGRNAAKSAAAEIDKQYMQSQPVMNTGTPADEYVGKTERQLEKQMSDAADQFVKNNMSSYIANAVSGEQDAALQRALNATNNVPSMAGLGGMGLMVKGKTFNEQVDPDLMIKNLEGNLDKNLQNVFSNPQVAQKIEADAKNLGVSVDTYIQRIVPSLRNSLANALNESEYQRALPKNMLDNVANRFINSNTLGKMIRLATQTKSQRVMNEQAMAATAAGENPYYKSGAIEDVAADVGGMVLDPVFGGAAKGGAMVASKLVGSGAKAAAVMANGTLAQRLGIQAAQTVVGSGTTGLLFDSTSSVVQNFSTGEDTSLGNTLKVALGGGAKGALNFSIMGLTGLPLSQLGRGVGIKAGGSFWGNVGRATGKVSLEAGKTYMEGMGMYLGSYAVGKLEGAKDANGKPIEFDLFDGTLESLPTAIGFRVQHALGGLKGGRKNAKGEDIGWLGSTVANVKEFLTSDKVKTSNMLMTEDERQQIFNSGAQNGVMRDGENIVSYARRTKKNKLRYDDPQMYADPAGKESIESDVEMMKNTYDQIMADPKVSWDAKAKFSAMVMGVMPDSRPMMDYCTFTTEKVGGDEAGVKKYINEYSADGTLLSKTSYDNVDKREQALYKMAMTKEGQRLWNVMGTLVGIDKNNYDYQNAFFMERVKDAKDGAEIQAFADGMGTKGSAVEQEFTNWVLNNGSTMKAIDAFARESGMKKEDVVKLMNKDPLHRTEEEQLLCAKLRREMEKQAFPADKVHEEQSNLEGKDVADDNSLGTEEPNTVAVAEQLDNLSKAEEGVEALMRDNDVFGDNFKKMQDEGMTNPQIYDWMIRNGGMTQEQLKPFADYINANARVQGMQQRTQQKIEEVVGKVVHDWSYRGTMNGAKTDGEQVLFVEDRDGRRLMVGSGDVAFDSVTGRAKEDVGDMLVCLDPETKELVYIKAEDAKFVGVQKPEDFANGYRQKLQEINSQPYNEAMQRQAERDAAKNQQETNEGETKTEVAAPEAPMQEEENPELYKVADSLQGKIGQSLSKDEADSLVSEMENRAEPARELELTPENWTAEFGEDGKVATPLGEVKMGENQYLKLARLGRRGKLGMIKPTLENPDLIIEDASRAKEGDTTERGSSYVFVKSFTGKDGERMYHFTSVTVQKDGKEVVISNQEKSENRIKKLLQDGKVVFIKGESSLHPKAQMEESVPRSDSQGSTSSDNQTLGLGVNSPELSVDKDTNNSSNGNGNEGTLTHSDTDYEKNDIPADKDGEPVYEQVPKERTVEDLFGKLGGDGNLAHSFAEAKVAEAEKEQKTLLKKEPKMGTKINEYLKKKREYEDAVKAAEAKVAYWNDVKGEIEKLTHTTLDELKEQQAELDGTAAATEHKALYGEGQPADGTALAAKFVADAKITPDSFKKETGFGTAEQAGFVGMIAKEENGGKSIERLAEDLVYYDNTEYNGTYFRNDTNEARNAIISALGAARTRKGLRELAQPDLAKFEGERAQERDNAYHEAYGMDYEEYLAYSEQEMPHILEKINNFDEEKYLHDKAEEITNQIDKEYGKAIRRDESAGEEPVHGEGDKVLPGTRTDERGGGESPEGHAGRTEAECRSNTENAALPEEASAGRVEEEQQKEVDEAVKHVATEITKQTGIDVVTDEREGQSALEDAEATDSDVKFHKETDKETLDKLNNGETVKVYRAMQVIDGKLYPPMAASVGGKLVEANELGTWIRADENPDLAIPDMDSKTGKQKVDKKTGELKWKFKLDKGGKDATGKKATDVNAAYNPYWHMSRSPLNDQFKSAWIRPNIVVVECEVPASELSSGYKAERAKDAVGEVDWKSGSVSGEVFKQTGRARKVILSRWCKPVRVLDDAEVAQRAKEFVGDAKVEIPENVLTPKQRIAFEKAGFKIGGPEKGVKKSEQIMDALERGLQIDNAVREHRASAGSTIRNWGKTPKELRMNESLLTDQILNYHGDYIGKLLEKASEDSSVSYFSAHDGKWYFYSVDKDRNINILDAVEASRENFDLFKDKLKEYGFDGKSTALRNALSSYGYIGRTDSDLLKSFLAGGTQSRSRLRDGETSEGRRTDGNRVAGEADGTQSEGDTQEAREIKQFRTKDGEVYGFTVDGKIYLDTKKMKPETPLHEYTHLWSEALKKKNPKEWENVKKLFDDVEGLKEEVQKLYPELEGDALYDEMIATYSGREGTKKLEAVVRELADKGGSGVAESVKEQGFIYKVKEALQKYWKGVADMLNIHFTTAEEVADKVLADWAKGVKPKEGKETGGETATRERMKVGIGVTYPVKVEDKPVRFEDLKAGDKFLDKNGYDYELKKWAKTDDGKTVAIVYGNGSEFVVSREITGAHDLLDLNDGKFDRIVSYDANPKEPLNPIERTALEYHEEKVGAARKAYEEAKASGDESETKRTRDEFKKALDDKLKAQGMGLVQRRKEIAKELGKEEAEKIDKPWKDMDGEERMAVAEHNPLTEEEIRNKTSEENQDLIEDAIDYLNGNHGFAQQIAYLKIYDDVRNRHENVSGDSGTGDRTQLDAANTTGGEGLGLGRGRESGGPDGPVDRGAGNEAASGERTGGESGKDDTTLPVGKQGDKQGEGSPSGMGGLSAGGADTTGGGAVSGDGHVSDGSGRGGIDRSSKPDARRKPAAKQGTTWRNRTGAEIKQEAKEAKEGLKAALKEMLKRGRGEASISLTGLNSRQIEYVPELMKAVKRYGMSLIDQGIYKVKDWMSNIREGIYDDMKAIGFTDKDIDDFIEEMWNSKMPMDGETHTIAEWSTIYGNAQLRKKLSEKLGEKYERQMAAEPIEVKVGDRKNIEETLPFLLPQQQEDVLKAETQFFGNEHADREHAYGKGYLFTNGTGTGKTYTGLGIAKRLAKQGKGRILFVTPSQKKVNDWMKDGKNLGLDIRDLDSWAKERGTTATTESGEGMVITTFANFGLNKKLLETEWDAVIYDECHRIMENKKGAETARSMQHYMMTNRDENHCFLRLQETNKDYQKMRLASEKFDEERSNEIGRIMREYKESHPEARTKDVINATYKLQPKELNSFAPADAARFPKLGKAYQEFTSAKEHYYKDVEPKLREQAKNTWKRTKTIFLSATPFNTRENLDYVEGYIFKYPEMGDDGMNGRTRFYLDHFGAAYKYRYHRLEQTVSNPDAVAKQEVAFSDYLQNTLGTMSGRIIDSPYDYSRDFPTVSPDHAEDFNIAVQDAVRGRYLGSAYRKTIGEYNYGSALFETMKVANIIDRIKQHLDAGRKVVIFHRRTETKTPIKPPFAYMLEVANKEISLMRPGKEREEYIREVNAFRKEHAGLLQWEQTLDYSMPREQLAKVFGKNNVLFFSGKESKAVKDKAVDTFNDDNSGKNIIVIQEASGKEGISLHDTTGKHQRVCITLGLPQSPITALQIEGRTYRIGNKSNAIFEYPVLGLNSEMMLFGEKFNNQVSTTENLALGSQARNLRESFANGILEHSGVVPIDQQGVGGKEFDAPKQGGSDPFDDAVLDYYSNQKLNRKNREGVDYFPTPEPLGYKMMEWARAGEGDTILEPSAGHGAIARYAPKENQLTGIEPSQSLFAKLQLKAGGLGRKFMNTVFENYDISNKHDVVVMNPPFGTAGATAIAHLDKAFKHLEEGGRVVAIIPRGSTDKKFDKWLDGQKNVAMRAEVDLPDIVFQQAGTSVVSRVVVLDKITDAALRSKAGKTERIDLSGRYDKIEDFFEELRDIEMPERIIDTQAKMQKKAKAAKTSIKEIKGVRDVKLDKNGILVSMRGDWMDYGISFSGSDKPQYWREKMSGFYEKYEELEKSTFNEDNKAVFSEMKELSCKLAGMTEDEMQRYIAGRRNSGEQDGVHFRTEEDIEDVNKRFNERLESLKTDPKQKGGELKLGYPGTFLKDAGFGDSEIVLEYAKIERKSSDEYKNDHPFDVEDIKDLPKAINAPIAVFDNTNGKEAGKTILTELQKDGKNFIVAIRAAERRQKGGIVLEVNEIKTLFPKEARGIVNWFNTGKTCNVDKEKALTWLGALRTHRGTWLTEQELSSATNVVKDFDIEKRKSLNFCIGDNKTEKQNNSVATISEDAPVVVKHVDRVSKETGVKVNMVQSAEEVSSPRVKKAIEEGKRITGWYDERTGEVHLYMPNIHDRYTAEKTIWHETVGHKGMRGLMGEQFDKFLRDMWYDLDKPENAELKKLVDEERRRNPLNIYDAIEEGIARLAEEGRGEPGFWRNIRNKVTDFFREIGYRIAPNTKDVKYLLWLSKNLQKNPNDVFYKMRAEAVRWRLDHETVPDVIEANGMFFDNDGKAHKSYLDMSKEEYEEATDGKIHLRTTPSAGTAIDRYHRALNEHGYMFTESYMDNMLSLQKLMLAIVPGKKIEDIASSENPYMLQNTMQGKMSTMAQRFNDDVMEPLNKVMAKALDAFDGKNQTEKTRSFNLYMIAKHGLERNRVFFVRDYIRDLEPSDAEILQRQWDAEKKDLGDKLRNGQIDLKEYYKTMDEWIRNNVDMDYKAGEHDYSGFHGLQEIDDKKAPYDDAEAIQSVMDSEAKMEDIKNGSVADLWSKINTATRYSLDIEYDGGMLTKENHDHVSEMFDWYVPLRKYDEATAEDMYGYVSENGDATTYIGPALMKAKGRKSLSNVNVLAQIGAMGNMSISRYGNNAVKMAFARFIRSNGGQGLVTETNLWVEKKGVDNNGNPIWEEAYPKIPENATADEISKIVSDFETDMKAKQAKGEARNLSTRGHIGFKFERAKDRDQHFVDVMIAGKTHRFVVNGNPRAAQALNGLLEHKAGGVGRVFAAISRFMAQTCTSYNPEFVMRNMIRDFEFASSNLLAKEGLKYTKVFEKYYAKVGLIEGIRNSKIKDLADTGGFGLYAKYRNGTLDTSNKIQRYFKEFMDNGGETGWVQVKNMKDLSKEYRRNIKTERNKVWKVGKGFYNLIFKNLENVNEIAENMARFATYCASRDSGRSAVRSAYDAKEVSTNFNRHGSASAIKSFKNGEMSGMQNARKQIYRFTSSYFRNTSMFFNAGIQSTNLLIKNFKHNPIGTAGYIAAGPMITAGLMALLNNVMIASEDEKDRKGVKDPYGELPDYIRRNNLCVYIGEGEFVTIPLAIEERAFYGLGDFVAGMTFADNISSQKLANLAENKKGDKWLNPAMDAVGCLSQLVPVMDYLGHASFGKEPVQETVKGFAPSAISPIVEWFYNSDWKGSPIQRDDKFDEEQPSWMLAYKGTPDFLVDINKKVNAATNTVAPGNENMKGSDFWDAVTNPSALQHFYSGYMGGAATFMERAVGLVKKGKDVETKDIPFVRSLLYTPNEQSSLQRTKTKWYNYQDEMAKTMSNVKRLKSKNVPADQLLRNYSDYFKFQDSKEAMKVQVIEEADKMIKEWKKLRNKSSDTESINYANHNIEMIMQESVEKLDKLSE